MIWIIFLIVLIVLLYTYFKNRPIFEEYKNLTEFMIVIFTVFFAIYQLNSSTDDFEKLIERLEGIIQNAEESKNSLKKVQESLSDLPVQIDSFSTSIRSLNTVVSTQKDQLGKTLISFNESILGFKLSVDQMAERFNRKPDIKIALKLSNTDSSLSIHSIVLTNKGNLLAEIFTVRLHLPNKYLISFEWKESIKAQEYEEYSTYQKHFTDQYVFPDSLKPLVENCNIMFSVNKRIKGTVFVYYTSAFGNDGVAEQDFIWTPKSTNSKN